MCGKGFRDLRGQKILTRGIGSGDNIGIVEFGTRVEPISAEILQLYRSGRPGPRYDIGEQCFEIHIVLFKITLKK